MRNVRRPFFHILPSKKTYIGVAALLFVAGIYLLLVVLAPNLPGGYAKSPSKQSYVTSEVNENRLYIPAIGVDISIIEGNDAAALNKGAWHRQPKSGNPKKGGNFVLSAHRFEIGLTPGQTRRKSPFYHIDKLKPGDSIYVDYNKSRYAYKVTKKYKVDRFALAIEAPSHDAKMTLYSCDLRGEKAGREVVESHPLGKIKTPIPR